MHAAVSNKRLIYLVEQMGVEPTTSALRTRLANRAKPLIGA
jgi:hypothetical protein